jgi:hypothetical protein
MDERTTRVTETISMALIKKKLVAVAANLQDLPMHGRLLTLFFFVFPCLALGV